MVLRLLWKIKESNKDIIIIGSLQMFYQGETIQGAMEVGGMNDYFYETNSFE